MKTSCFNVCNQLMVSKNRTVQKKGDGTTRTVSVQQNVSKKIFVKRFAVPLDFDFFKYPVYLYELKKDFLVNLELNSSEKVIFCSGYTTTTRFEKFL